MPAQIAIIGAGYVGLPLAVAFAEAGCRVTCVDVDAARVAELAAGRTHVEDVAGATLVPLVRAGSIAATTDYAAVADAEAILICVPTPLSENREPDVSIIASATESIRPYLRRGQLVVLESTTYPGTTREVLQPVLERDGLVAGRDFHLAMSPERIDPGRTDFTVRTTPKVVGGLTPACLDRAVALYSICVDRLVPVSSPDAAELAKLLENIFRSVNIALVNELAMLCDRLSLNVWEVVDAAATKPYGFMRFTPGARPGRPLHPDRPVLPVVARPPVRLPDRVHRAGRQGQHRTCRITAQSGLAARSTATASRSPAAGCCCSACRTRPTSAMSANPPRCG